MTNEEEKSYKAQALLLHHESKCKVEAHATKLSEIAKQLEGAAQILQKLEQLEITNVNNQNLVVYRGRKGQEKVIYPSMEELVSEFKEYHEAIKERDDAQKKCHRLGVAGF